MQENREGQGVLRRSNRDTRNACYFASNSAWQLAHRLPECGLMLALLLSILLTRPAFAHRSFFNATVEAGSGSLAQQSVSGQWGITETSPFYFYGEASHEAFYLAPDDNSIRGLGEVGFESTHVGLAARGGYLSGPFESLALVQFGGTVFYRFVPWSTISNEESMFLKREERKAIIERHVRETNEALPKAPLLALSLDQFSVSSGLSKLASINPLRIEGSLRASFEPFWTFVPSISFYSYDTLPVADVAGNTSYASRALRLVRLGPNGAYSGIFGLPDNTQQIYSQIKLFPLVQIDAAVTRVSLDTPSYIGYSFWIGFDRFLTGDKRWAVSPSYEQYFLEGQTYSYFTISFRYGAASSWVPSADKMPNVP